MQIKQRLVRQNRNNTRRYNTTVEESNIRHTRQEVQINLATESVNLHWKTFDKITETMKVPNQILLSYKNTNILKVQHV